LVGGSGQRAGRLGKRLIRQRLDTRKATPTVSSGKSRSPNLDRAALPFQHVRSMIVDEWMEKGLIDIPG
jgi:hypothetical protein